MGAASGECPANNGSPQEQTEIGTSSQQKDISIDGQSKKAAISTSSSENSQSTITDDGSRPQLPPRPSNLSLLQENAHSPDNSQQRPRKSSRPHLQSTATTALSRTDIHTQSYQDGSRETFAATAETTIGRPARTLSNLKRYPGLSGSEGGDSASVTSYAPTLEASGDVESLLGEVLGGTAESPAWKLLSGRNEVTDPFDTVSYEDDEVTAEFYREFDEIPAVDLEGENEGIRYSLIIQVKERSILIHPYRAALGPMEIEAEAFPYTLFRW